MTTGNFIDHRISTRVSTEFRRVLNGKTDITTLASGHERRNAAWVFKRLQYTATYNQLTTASQQELVSAFYACNAQLLLFRFKDWGDFTVAGSPVVVPPSAYATRNPVQLTKRYTFGPISVDRLIQAVVTCVVTDDTGATKTGVFDSQLGTFVPDVAWSGARTYTWTGQFDVWVRFNNDALDTTLKTQDIATTDVELIEGLAYTTGS